MWSPSAQALASGRGSQVGHRDGNVTAGGHEQSRDPTEAGRSRARRGAEIAIRDFFRLGVRAALAEVVCGAGRGIDKPLLRQLGSCQWVKAHQNVILLGPTAIAKATLPPRSRKRLAVVDYVLFSLASQRLTEQLRLRPRLGSRLAARECSSFHWRPRSADEAGSIAACRIRPAAVISRQPRTPQRQRPEQERENERKD